ncbi:hypothetical protein EGR_06346 [Echinococcus granulosus]|uniref:Uncharacterized protein n=1 Tax=Echinococcus granulosus TaxID=6210 RepID=W6UL21_ECHGR|nr:hypothetical protein EGR_06346 [Echinococcus granulosus]EUB58797.1 hypothetical protein EGR_06346 [Echinococcus granulosus]
MTTQNVGDATSEDGRGGEEADHQQDTEEEWDGDNEGTRLPISSSSVMQSHLTRHLCGGVWCHMGFTQPESQLLPITRKWPAVTPTMMTLLLAMFELCRGDKLCPSSTKHFRPLTHAREPKPSGKGGG